jgi:hypothetical protein
MRHRVAEDNEAYYQFFLSCDGKNEEKHLDDKADWRHGNNQLQMWEKKRKGRLEKEREEEDCSENQRSAQNYGYCCHQHAMAAKTEHDKHKVQMIKQKEKEEKLVDEPDHCIHCDKDPCVFIPIKNIFLKVMIFTSTRKIMRRVMWPTIVLNASVLSSTLHSFNGRE